MDFSANVFPRSDNDSLQHGMEMDGVQYLHTITDANTNLEMHEEQGYWLHVPQATGLPYIVRHAASTPHRTSLLMHGQAVLPVMEPVIDTDSILTHPTPPESPKPIIELDYVDAATANLPAGITNTKAISNPNVLLADTVKAQKDSGESFMETVVLDVKTGPNPRCFAFMPQAIPQRQQNNAVVVQATATFWIETIQLPDSNTVVQLQYTQTVVVNCFGVNCA